MNRQAAHPMADDKMKGYSYQGLIEARDRFAQELQSSGVAGVISVGLTKDHDGVALLVAVREGANPRLPNRYERLGVVVEHFGDAVGYHRGN